MSHFALAVPLALACATLGAQNSAVIPPAFATVEGDILEPEPFAYQQVAYRQYVDASLLQGVPNGALINSVSYRRDWNLVTAATMSRTIRSQPATAIWEIWMVNHTGPVLSPPNSLTPFTGWTNVMTPLLINFPNLTRGPGPTANFDLTFALDRPFLYGGGSLGIAHYAYETTGGTTVYYMDAVSSPVSSGTVGRISPTAVGCPAGQNRAEGYAPNPGGGALEMYLYGGQPGVAAAAYLGASATSWFGLPLPVDLGVIGLTGCQVHTDLLVAFPATVDLAGVASMRLQVPASPDLVSSVLFGQWVARDDRVNPSVRIATSDGLRYTLGPDVGPYSIPMSVVSAVGNLAAGRVGFIRRGEGLVFKLGW